MRHNYPYLTDFNFLKSVDEMHIKEQYAKITILNWNESPIQEIQGIVTGGNINLDGKSKIKISLKQAQPEEIKSPFDYEASCHVYNLLWC